MLVWLLYIYIYTYIYTYLPLYIINNNNSYYYSTYIYIYTHTYVHVDVKLSVASSTDGPDRQQSSAGSPSPRWTFQHFHAYCREPKDLYPDQCIPSIICLTTPVGCKLHVREASLFCVQLWSKPWHCGSHFTDTGIGSRYWRLRTARHSARPRPIRKVRIGKLAQMIPGFLDPGFSWLRILTARIGRHVKARACHGFPCAVIAEMEWEEDCLEVT